MLYGRPFVCPPSLVTDLADAQPQPMAVVAANSAVVLESAWMALRHGLVEPVLVGDPARIKGIADEIGWTLAGCRIVPAEDDAAAARTSVALARRGEVAALMKGHIHTDMLMRAVLDKREGLRTGRRMTHVFHMSVPYSTRELIISDAAINVAPDIEMKLDIVRNAVGLAHALGNPHPRVALLSATEEPSEKMPSSMEAAAVVRRLEAEGLPDCDVYGPLAIDNAVSPVAARLKSIEHPVAGNADILVVPNIETGNALFKMMVYFIGATAAGIAVGATVPIVLTSRADPPEARVAAAALARRVTAAAVAA